MDVDFSRLPTGAASWSSLIDHALSLGDLSEVDFLELKTGLPFGSRAERKSSGALLARQVLGFANRMPDVAASHIGGHGVVLVGISGSDVTGAAKVDGTDLHDAIQPFLGEQGPHWDYQYIVHEAGLVLAIVIDPPRWGDPIWPCVRDFGSADVGNSLRDGDVYVRSRGRTRLANSYDLAKLDERIRRDAAVGAIVTLGYDGKFERVNTPSVQAVLEQEIDKSCDALLKSLPRSRPESTVAQFGISMPRVTTIGEDRSPERFRAEVEEWRLAAKGEGDTVSSEFWWDQLGHGRLTITNSSDLYLEAVRVEIAWPTDVRILVGSDMSYCDHGGPFNFLSLLPKAPAKWGTGAAWYLRDSVTPLTNFRSALATELEIETTTSGSTLRWSVGDLRPRATEVCAEETLALTDGHRETVEAAWKATSRGVNGIYTGTITIHCAQEPNFHIGISV